MKTKPFSYWKETQSFRNFAAALAFAAFVAGALILSGVAMLP